MAELLFFKFCFAVLTILISLIGFATQYRRLAATIRTYVKRPEWLCCPGVSLQPIKRFARRARIQSSDEELCDRILSAYRRADRHGETLTSGIWSANIRKRCHFLKSTLKSGNVGRLSQLLSGMFQEEFLHGISSARAGLRSAAFTRMKLAEEVLGLAEALGLVRAEAPEQGTLGHGFTIGLPELVRRIEAHLNANIGWERGGVPRPFTLDFPNVGAPYGFQIGESLITPETPEHVYVAFRIRDVLLRQYGSELRPRVLEIGAGFGGTAYWLKRIMPVEHYTIVDLPLMNVVQAYFLGKVFGESAIQLYGEFSSNGQSIRILPAHAKDKIEDFDLLLNENSMPEIPEASVRDYLFWAAHRCDGLFYSYNQEAHSCGSDGILQTLVPQLVAENGRYRLLSRNCSWIRRGYVEEVYSVVPSMFEDVTYNDVCSNGGSQPREWCLPDIHQRTGAVTEKEGHCAGR